MLQSYNFLHNARTPLGAIAARPRFPLWRGTFFRSPSPPYAHPNSQTLDQRKKTVHFLDKCVHFRKKLPSFFLPSLHYPFSLPPSLARVSSRAHALSEFSFFAFTARRFAHNPLITSGLRVKPSPYILHDTSNITHCATILCGEGRGEGKNPKKGEGKQGEAFTRISLFDNNLRPNGEEVKAKNRKIADARAYARVVSFFTAVGRYPIGTRNTGSTKRAQSLFATLP